MNGCIRNNSCYLEITVFGRRNSITGEALIDTGFEGYLTLPITEATNLGLELIGTCNITLADGSTLRDEPLYDAYLLWDNVLVEIQVDLTKTSEVLIGTELFTGYKVILDYPKKEVLIEKGNL